MSDPLLSESDWQLRAALYARFVAQGCAPTAGEMAALRGDGIAETQAAYRRLQEAHQILLDEAGAIRMANPLSGRPTDYAVYLADERRSTKEQRSMNERRLWANCAWDALGVSALLEQDARMVAQHPNTREEMSFAVVNGDLNAPDSWQVHFALPVRRWYDDLIHT